MLVVNVRGILQSLPKEQLEAVFSVGLKMLDSEELQLQLHEESGLLFAKGTPQVLRMIQNSVEELSRGMEMGPFGRAKPQSSEGASSPKNKETCVGRDPPGRYRQARPSMQAVISMPSSVSRRDGFFRSRFGHRRGRRDSNYHRLACGHARFRRG